MSFNSSAGALSNFFPPDDSNAVPGVRAARDAQAPADMAAAGRRGNEPTITDWTSRSRSPQEKILRFGDYELLEEIARGGMGVVFKARNASRHRIVALKMILAGQLASGDDVLRFHIETEAASKLDHPNIVPIYEVGQVDGQHYFTMRLIEGESLAECLASGPLEPCRAARLLACIAEAVQHAHDRGVIHRDLKPDNILLDGEGRPHITDFGVARRTYEHTEVTDVGQILGTPNYMPPEQAAGDTRRIGPAADVYSLGAVLYTMLTGRPPFECNRLDLLVQVLEREPVAPRRLNLCIPPDLETICLKCLAKEPAKRYPSAAELAADLERFLANQPIRAKAVCLAARAAKWVRRQPVVAAAVALAAGAIVMSLAGVCWQWRRAEAARVDATEKLHSAYYAQAQASRLSRRAGGKFVALEALRKAVQIRPTVALRSEAIACMTLFDLQVENTLPDGDLLGAPDFTKGFDRIAYSDKQGAIVVRDWPQGETICRLAAGRQNDALRLPVVQFSPNGRQLAAAMHYDAAHDLWLWDLKQCRPVLKATAAVHAMAMDFSPDGGLLAAGRPDGTLVLHETAGGKQKASWKIGLAPHTIRFAPRGSLLAISGENAVKLLDCDDGEVLQVLEHPDAVRGVAWSPDGELLATACADHHVYLWNSRSGERYQVLEGHRSEVVHVVFNHRGDLLASHGWDGRTQVWNVRTGAALMRSPGLALSFRGDDRQLAFTGSEIGVWRVAGARKRRVLKAADKDRLWCAEIDPDSRIAALARQDGVRFWDLTASAEIGWLDIGPVRLASFQRDGRGIVTWGSAGLLHWPIRSDRGGEELTIGPPESLGLRASDLPEFGAVSADGRILAVADRAYGELYIYDLFERRLVFRGPHANASRIAVSPDGAWVVGGTWSAPHPAVRRWDARLPAQVDHWPIPNGAMPAFSPDGRWLWIGAPREGELLDATTWQTVRELPIKGAAVGAGIFSPDSSLLAVNAASDRVELVDPVTGQEIAALETSIPLCFNREGNLLLTQDDDQTAYVWDLARIRRRLANMKLDWNGPPLTPWRPASRRGSPVRMRMRVLSAETP